MQIIRGGTTGKNWKTGKGKASTCEPIGRKEKSNVKTFTLE